MSLGTDDEYQVRAAAQSHKWRWPSDMHNSGTIKTNTKDGMILLLVLFQKLFRNNHGQRPLTALYGFTVAVSGLLIFFIGKNYWTPLVGFWLMVLYLVSIWPWQTALYGGHIGVATMAFLAGVLTVQQIIPTNPNFLILLAAGALFCFMLFSSGSSIKYIPLVLAALLFSKFQLLPHLAEMNYQWDAILLGGLILLFIFLKVLKKQIVDFLFDKQSYLSRQLNLIEGQTFFSKEHYYRHVDKKLPLYFKNSFLAYIGLSATAHFLGWSYLLPLFLGFLILFLILTLPKVGLNTRNYLRHILSPTRKTRFAKYLAYFVKRGINLTDDFRAPLWPWLILVSWRIAPLQTLLITGALITTFTNTINLTPKILILVTALLPILWGELTRTTRSLRTYNPSLIGALTFLGYASAPLSWPYFWTYLFLATGIIGLQQAWVFFGDALPARLAISNLIDALDRYDIHEFYTYDTRYNDGLAGAVNFQRPAHKKFTIRYMEKLDEVKNGWIVIPPTNSQSISMECVPEGMAGDFTKDPKLNELLTTRKIEQLATAKFKTFGSSKIWPQEADVTTYLDLILKEIGAKERFRGYAWLINAKALAKT